MDTQLIETVLEMALLNSYPNSKLLIHSDRGNQYCAESYQTMLKDNNVVSGGCIRKWVNPPSERLKIMDPARRISA